MNLDISIQGRKGAVGGIVRALRECYQGLEERCSSVGGFLGGDEVKCCVSLKGVVGCFGSLQSSMLQAFHGWLNMHVCTHVMHTYKHVNTYMIDTNM